MSCDTYIQCFGLSPTDLKDLITTAVNEAVLSAFQNLQATAPPQKPSNELLTKKQAAFYLKVSLVTLSKQVKEGFIPCYRIGNSNLRFKKNDLEKCMDTIRNKKHTRIINHS